MIQIQIVGLLFFATDNGSNGTGFGSFQLILVVLGPLLEPYQILRIVAGCSGLYSICARRRQRESINLIWTSMFGMEIQRRRGRMAMYRLEEIPTSQRLSGNSGRSKNVTDVNDAPVLTNTHDLYRGGING